MGSSLALPLVHEPALAVVDEDRAGRDGRRRLLVRRLALPLPPGLDRRPPCSLPGRLGQHAGRVLPRARRVVPARGAQRHAAPRLRMLFFGFQRRDALRQALALGLARRQGGLELADALPRGRRRRAGSTAAAAAIGSGHRRRRRWGRPRPAAAAVGPRPRWPARRPRIALRLLLLWEAGSLSSQRRIWVSGANLCRYRVKRVCFRATVAAQR